MPNVQSYVRSWGRGSNITLLISTQGTGAIVYVTIILPLVCESLRQDFAKIICDFENRSDRNDDKKDVNIGIAYSESGYVNTQIYQEHCQKLFSEFACPTPTADSPHLAQQDNHSSRGTFENNRRINKLLTQLHVDNFFGSAHSTSYTQANDRKTNLRLEQTFQELMQNRQALQGNVSKRPTMLDVVEVLVLAINLVNEKYATEIKNSYADCCFGYPFDPTPYMRPHMWQEVGSELHSLLKTYDNILTIISDWESPRSKWLCRSEREDAASDIHVGEYREANLFSCHRAC